MAAMGDQAIVTSDSEKDIESTATGGSSDKVSPQSDGKLYLMLSCLSWLLLIVADLILDHLDHLDPEIVNLGQVKVAKKEWQNMCASTIQTVWAL